MKETDNPNNPLVSIVTPCYNGEKYIDDYFRSLKEQTYHNCQLIFMDDGSSDRTKEIIYSYKDELEELGYQFEYHYHENIGLGGTVAEGVFYIRGDYFIWPDIDDIMTPDSIEKKLRFLQKYPQYGLVRSDYGIITESNKSKIQRIGPDRRLDRKKETLFSDYLVSKNMWLQPGCYMIRTDAWIDSNPDRYMYSTRRGQNWQILLPILYKYKCGYIEEPLYLYLVRDNSLSNQHSDNYEDLVTRYSMFEEIITKTLEHMSIDATEKEDYIKNVRDFYIGQKLSLAFRFDMPGEVEKYYTYLRKNRKLTMKQRVKYYGRNSKLLHKV